MSRTVIDIDDEMLVRAQRSLGTGTKRDTVNAALELAAATDANRRARALETFRALLERLDVARLEQEEADDHSAQAG
jgi:Arc/MetJ family transcription regulator